MIRCRESRSPPSKRTGIITPWRVASTTSASPPGAGDSRNSIVPIMRAWKRAESVSVKTSRTPSWKPSGPAPQACRQPPRSPLNSLCRHRVGRYRVISILSARELSAIAMADPPRAGRASRGRSTRPCPALASQGRLSVVTRAVRAGPSSEPGLVRALGGLRRRRRDRQLVQRAERRGRGEAPLRAAGGRDRPRRPEGPTYDEVYIDALEQGMAADRRPRPRHRPPAAQRRQLGSARSCCSRRRRASSAGWRCLRRLRCREVFRVAVEVGRRGTRRIGLRPVSASAEAAGL